MNDSSQGSDTQDVQGTDPTATKKVRTPANTPRGIRLRATSINRLISN
jgi:hypothetical protein